MTYRHSTRYIDLLAYLKAQEGLSNVFFDHRVLDSCNNSLCSTVQGRVCLLTR